MNNYEDDLANMLGTISDFSEIDDAELDDDGTFIAPMIALRDLVIYPNMVTPLFVGRDRSFLAIQAAGENGGTLLCFTQTDPEIEYPNADELFTYGCELAPGRSVRLPDGTASVLVQGRRRVEIVEHLTFEPYHTARVRVVDEIEEDGSEVEAQKRVVLSLFERCVQLNRQLPEDAFVYALNIEDPGWLADLVASTIDLSTEQRQKILETLDVSKRLMDISILLGKELSVLEIEDQIHNRVQQEVDKTQREVLLREQMRAIQSELGEESPELAELRARLSKKKLPEVVMKRAKKELGRLAEMQTFAPEAGIIRTYLDWIIELPWTEKTEDNLDITNAVEVLDSEHYGLDKAKDRVIEHMAIRKLAPEKMKSPVLCFVGPPGTGKTSLGKSIASALGREFIRISLGGIRDEAEIRGHRRTYIGALPGRIIQAMRRAGTANPVFMLDEIDKVGMDFRGDPSSALLEVLDPEQNNVFSDHYLELDYDLHEVMFITTANFTDPLQDALLDRLEVIEFSGYIEEEKIEIARRFLIPRELEAHGIEDLGLVFEEKALKEIIRHYTYESGVRNFERRIATICRKVARKSAEGKKHPKRITATNVGKFLGPSRVPKPLINEKDEVGMALGLAWTLAGGEISPVEVNVVPGKGVVTLTGSLGDVMQESAQAAITYMRSIAEELEIDSEDFENMDMHIHLPEGAVPKDGPSAGITLATTLISAFTDRPVRRDVAMTGEITLRGRVLPVGGIREKVLSAYRVNVNTVIIPKDNEKDLADVPKKALNAMTIHAVSHMSEVMDIALLPADLKSETKKAAEEKAAELTEESGDKKDE